MSKQTIKISMGIKQTKHFKIYSHSTNQTLLWRLTNIWGSLQWPPVTPCDPQWPLVIPLQHTIWHDLTWPNMVWHYLRLFDMALYDLTWSYTLLQKLTVFYTILYDFKYDLICSNWDLFIYSVFNLIPCWIQWLLARKNKKNAYFEPFTLILWLVLEIYHHLRIY